MNNSYISKDKKSIKLKISPYVLDAELNKLFCTVWDDHVDGKYQKVLSKSLFYVCAYIETSLIGYVNVAWDGNEHGFILDTTVQKNLQRKGIGTMLVQEAIKEGLKRNLKWLHVDFLPHLREFYLACGFRPTEAGLVRLRQ